MNIEDIKKTYKDEWILVEVLKEDEKGKPIEIRLIAHSKSREDIYDKLKETRGMDTFQFYTGEIPKKGYAVAFHACFKI